MKKAAKLMSWAIGLGCASCVFAADYANSPQSPASAPASAASAAKGQMSPSTDNTDINARDRGGATKTPQDQTNRVPDRKLLAAVRRTVVHDKSLSTKAHNIKIMVQGGGVTLRGPVNSEGEKTKIESLAKGVRGVMTVDNQLDIKTR